MKKTVQDKSGRAGKTAKSPGELDHDEVRLLRRIAKRRALQLDEADAVLTQKLLARGAIEKQSSRLVLSSAGKQTLRRIKLAEDEEQVFASQHQQRETVAIDLTGVDYKKSDSPKQCTHRRINRAESPLDLLSSKKRGDGSPYLTPSQQEAGKRLRAEFERGNMVPSMGINWDKLGEAVGSVSKNARLQQTGNGISDTVLGAQQRFRNAVDYVGEEFAGALIDFCCFLKGLEEIERARYWPARSAKQILAMALSRLARHYGLSDSATGPTRGPMRHWGTKDYQPRS